jgi:hypothetical protein
VFGIEPQSPARCSHYTDLAFLSQSWKLVGAKRRLRRSFFKFDYVSFNVLFVFVKEPFLKVIGRVMYITLPKLSVCTERTTITYEF